MAYFTKNDDGTYTEVTDKLYTETEYKDVKTKNNELRQTNTNLLKTNETLSAFADVLDGAQNITPEGLMKKIEEKATAKAGTMVSEMKTKHQTELEDLTKKLTGATGTLNKLTLSDAVRKAAPKHGVLDTAYEDVMFRAERDFEIKDGAIVRKDGKLDSSGAAYTVESWLGEVVKSAPHLAKTPTGPGARQNAGQRTNTVNSGERKTGMDLISSGLASKKSDGKSIN